MELVYSLGDHLMNRGCSWDSPPHPSKLAILNLSITGFEERGGVVVNYQLNQITYSNTISFQLTTRPVDFLLLATRKLHRSTLKLSSILESING